MVRTIADVAWDEAGRVQVILQDAGTGEVLALDAMDRAALADTLSTGVAVFAPHEEGATRGCAADGPPLMVVSLRLSCDGRTVLLNVQPAAPICRSGTTGCFDLLAVPWADDAEAAAARSVDGGIEAIPIRWSPEAAEGA